MSQTAETAHETLKDLLRRRMNVDLRLLEDGTWGLQPIGGGVLTPSPMTALHPRGEQPVALELGGQWLVMQETPGGTCMAVFTGPWAEWRARQYARAIVNTGVEL